jgi:threonine dehydrogenase-like Zn-dependent dehydrogenase
MEQLTKVENGRVEWRAVAEPELGAPGEALVRPLAVALCDIDHPIVHGHAPIPGEIALGHEQVGEVTAVGEEVAHHSVGDIVSVPFQISCGACGFCTRGRTGDCEAVPPQSMYGFGRAGGDWGGALSDLVRVPFADAMLVTVPEGLEPVSVASASDNVVDGWRTVSGPLARRPGAPVLVVGGVARSVGLYAVDAALALGAESVTYTDSDEARLAVAADLGAEVVEGPPSDHLGTFPVTVDASASHIGLKGAIGATERGGECTHVGILYEAETSLPLLQMYVNGIQLHVGRAMARADLPAVLEHCAAGRLRPERVTSRVAPWEAAAEAVLEFETKLVVTR